MNKYRKYNGRFDHKPNPYEFPALTMVVGLALTFSLYLHYADAKAPNGENYVKPVETPINANLKPTVALLKAPASKPKTIPDQLTELAKKRNFKWPSYLVRLAKCESRFDPKARNDNGAYGVDRGLFQINNKYHPQVSDAEADDIVFSANYTMDLIEKGYQHRWMCDKIVKGNFNY